jgi:hypothetical protein
VKKLQRAVGALQKSQPSLGAASNDSTSLFSASHLDGAAATYTKRSLGTGPAPAAARDDPPPSHERTQIGTAPHSPAVTH